MTEKRFNVFDVDGTVFLEDHKEGSYHIGEKENVDIPCLNDIADRLNTYADENEQLKKENKELKSILQDMGLIMSNEEVKNVRDEIASKLIKPLCKGNGFDVDVDTENGFTIIPKEDFE